MPFTVLGHQVDTLHVSWDSHKYEHGAEYAGLIIFLKDGQTEWTMDDGRSMKIGYIVIAKSNALKAHPSPQGVVHGSCFRYFFGEEFDKQEIVLTGFSYRNGAFKFTSRLCNHTRDGIAPQIQQAAIEKAVNNFWHNNTQNTSCR